MFNYYLTISGQANYVYRFISSSKYNLLYSNLPKKDILKDYNGQYDVVVEAAAKSNNEFIIAIDKLSNDYPELFFDCVGFNNNEAKISLFSIKNSNIIDSECSKVCDFEEQKMAFVDFVAQKFLN